MSARRTTKTQKQPRVGRPTSYRVRQPEAGHKQQMSATAFDHTYKYAFASQLADTGSRDLLRLATSGGANEFPYFFQGQIKQPRLTALLLRSLSKVVTARFHIPAAMLRRILDTRDPVVTSGGGLLRFEGFSACCSAYARVDLNPDAYDGVVVGRGT